MRFVVWVTAMIVLLNVSPAFCQTVEERLKALESRVASLENKVNEQARCIKEQESCIGEQKQRIAGYESRLETVDGRLDRQYAGTALVEEGLRIGAGATMIVQGTGNTNNTDPAKQSRADASYSADLTFEKEFSDIAAKAFVHLESGQGGGIEEELTLYSNVNRDIDNDNNVRVTEVWYEQYFAGEKAALTFGKLDPTAYFDNNAAANDETTQFLGRIFRNNPVIAFPDNTAGIRFGFAAMEWLELGAGVFDANADFEEVGDDLFTVAEVNFKPGFLGREGNYRLLAWNSGADHTDWRDAAKTGENAYGWGLSFDQELTDTLVAFFRYGWQDPDVYNPGVTTSDGRNFSLEQSWSAGVQIAGNAWGRENDVLGLAVGQAIPSDEYKKANPGIRAEDEGHFEAYYNIHVNDNLSISPDFQYIWNPFGKDVAGDTSPVFVLGLRAQVDF